MRKVLLACALVFGTAVGCSSSYTPGEYAAVGYRAPSHGDAGAPSARSRLRARAAAARRQTAPGPAAGAVEAARPGAPRAGAGPS
jgi:hypothetical protein